MMRAMVLDSYDWFKELIAERRGFSQAEITQLADGSVFSGRQALDRKLIDGVGGIEATKKWLAERGVDEDLKIVEWKKPEPGSDLIWAGAIARWLGFDLGKKSPLEAIQERLFLDGLTSVWHVDG
jgi:protease-4